MAHVRQNSRVTSLDLSENRIGYKESSGAIVQGTPETRSSSEQGAPEPQLTSGEAIALMLEENSTLTKLELSWNFIAAGSAAAIVLLTAGSSYARIGLNKLALSAHIHARSGCLPIPRSRCLPMQGLKNTKIF